MNLFTFRQGVSTLHGLDTRCKIFLVCVLSLAILGANFYGCLILLGVLVFFASQAGTKIRAILKQLHYFILFLIIIILVRGLTIPGEPLVALHGITLTRQGLAQGGVVALRFFLVMVTGLLFSATTPPSEIKGAAQWYLKPIPLVPEKRVAIMISLALRFLPLILSQARETADALRSRGGNLEKNPVKRFVRITLPLLKKTFLAADHLILAMEARCYDENRTDPEFNPSGKEGRFILASLVFWLGLAAL